MPKTSSAKKALRQSRARAEHNKGLKRELKNTVKDFKKLVDAGKTDEAKKELVLVYKKLDKAAKTNLIKKNTASRLKSRLTRHLARKSK